MESRVAKYLSARASDLALPGVVVALSNSSPGVGGMDVRLILLDIHSKVELGLSSPTETANVLGRIMFTPLDAHGQCKLVGRFAIEVSGWSSMPLSAERSVASLGAGTVITDVYSYMGMEIEMEETIHSTDRRFVRGAGPREEAGLTGSRSTIGSVGPKRVMNRRNLTTSFSSPVTSSSSPFLPVPEKNLPPVASFRGPLSSHMEVASTADRKSTFRMFLRHRSIDPWGKVVWTHPNILARQGKGREGRGGGEGVCAGDRGFCSGYNKPQTVVGH
ncbi:hypothetical protein AXG93_108s1080 [Marchantia polymorpha subsp. ruderalis]|uniref:Uncharacterized protein n=1 Tax=Marchantia polymorpha subsp. ruderalis TaxID=1480154 RepID=A0A176VWR3_MARPO|nr:hypothetical protein AXG93_108s1080 [Marchantia polymorpha subsp. ruderalis]